MTETTELKQIASRVRASALRITSKAGSGHPGGSLSCTDILVALYFSKMNIDPKDPNMQDRDRFVLCKGHAAPALYSVLAERGFFDKAQLENLRQMDSMLEGHPKKGLTPGIDASTGSLGQGLSIAVGMALAARLDKSSRRIYAVLGDGESQEGQVWEAAMSAAHYRLSNITAFTDRNRLQIDGVTEKVMSLEPLAQKWKAFGWNVLEIDGHELELIISAIDASKESDKPTMIIANTTKGKGVSFMENVCEYHGKPLCEDELKIALEEIDQ
jgi:transketolase